MSPLVTIAHANDSLAARVHAILEQRFGAASVHFVMAEQLGSACVWQHALRHGQASSRLEFPSGLVLASDDAFVLFNRIRHALMPHFQRASEYDRSYALSEMHALLLSWLHSLGRRVVNPPCPPELCGRDYSRVEALHMAAQVGLETASYAFSSHPRTLPLDGAFRFQRIESQVAGPNQNLLAEALPIAGPLPAAVSDCSLTDEVSVVVAGSHRTRPDIPLPREALARLQSLGGHPVMELRLAPCQGGGWKLAHLSSFPEADDWESAQVVADYLAEQALSGGGS